MGCRGQGVWAEQQARVGQKKLGVAQRKLEQCVGLAEALSSVNQSATIEGEDGEVGWKHTKQGWLRSPAEEAEECGGGLSKVG